MTIRPEDRQTYQSVVSGFARQEEENTCLSRAIENTLDELAERHGRPDLHLEHEEILEACDYLPQFGCSVEYLPERLAEKISGEYSVNIETHIELEELEELIENNRTSYPIVELSPSYLHHVDGYEIQAGMYGRAIPHTVVAFKINDEVVQFFDPFEDFYSPPDEGGAPPSQITKRQFYEYWSGREEARWTLWIEQESDAQMTLDQIRDMTSGDGTP